MVTMKTMTSETVTLDELATELGCAPEYVRELAGKKALHEDALGRPCVTADVAHRLVTEADAQRLEAANDVASFASYQRVRATARRAVVEEAYRRALAKASAREQDIARQIDSGKLGGFASFRTGGYVSLEARGHAIEAARIAGARFDRQYPDPSGVDEYVKLGRPQVVEVGS